MKTDGPHDRRNCDVSTNQYMEESHLWYISNSNGADFVQLGDYFVSCCRSGEFRHLSGQLRNCNIRRRDDDAGNQ